MHQTKESNKRAPGRVVIYILVHLVLIYTLAFRNILLVLALNLIVHKSSYCKCSLAWCQARTFLLFTTWTHPLQMREYPLRYASTDKNKKSHYSRWYVNQLVSTGMKKHLRFIRQQIWRLMEMQSVCFLWAVIVGIYRMMLGNVGKIPAHGPIERVWLPPYVR